MNKTMTTSTEESHLGESSSDTRTDDDVTSALSTPLDMDPGVPALLDNTWVHSGLAWRKYRLLRDLPPEDLTNKQAVFVNIFRVLVRFYRRACGDDTEPPLEPPDLPGLPTIPESIADIARARRPEWITQSQIEKAAQDAVLFAFKHEFIAESARKPPVSRTLWP
jgi:hypothetical protein